MGSQVLLSMPKIVIRIGHSEFLPYDSVALLAEVKLNLTKSSLTKALQHLADIRRLEMSPHRFNTGTMGSAERVEENPFRLVVAFNTQIKNDGMGKLLTEHFDV